MPRVKLFDENEVLTKAMNLFWKQGYAATSVQDLVSALGINRASLYSTFGDKDQLFRKAFNFYRTTSLEGLTTFFEQHSDVKQGLSKLFNNAIHEALTDSDRKGCFVVNTTTELIPNDTTLLAVLEQHKQDIELLFLNYMKKGQEEGQFSAKQDLKCIASLLFTFYNGVRVVSKIRPDSEELSSSVDAVLSLLD